MHQRWRHQVGESHADSEGRFPWTRVNPLQPTGANAISGIWHSAFGSHSIVPVRVETGTPKILAISKLAWPPLIAKLRNTCYRVTKVCEEAIKIYFVDTRAHFLPKQLANSEEISSILLQNTCIAGSKSTTQYNNEWMQLKIVDSSLSLYSRTELLA